MRISDYLTDGECMPFGGEAFEEFVAEYFRYMHRSWIVNQHLDYLQTREMRQECLGETGQAHWGDIDVLAIERDKAIVVSCDENCSKTTHKVIGELCMAESHIKERYPFVSSIEKFYAFCTGWAPEKNKEKLTELLGQGIKILTFADMLQELLRFLREDSDYYRKTVYKVTEPVMWTLREIEMIKVLTGRDVLPEPPEAHIREAHGVKKREKIIISKRDL